jgi:hypothetical protein
MCEWSYVSIRRQLFPWANTMQNIIHFWRFLLLDILLSFVSCFVWSDCMIYWFIFLVFNSYINISCGYSRHEHVQQYIPIYKNGEWINNRGIMGLLLWVDANVCRYLYGFYISWIQFTHCSGYRKLSAVLFICYWSLRFPVLCMGNYIMFCLWHSFVYL